MQGSLLMDDLDSFDGWLKYQQMDLKGQLEATVAMARATFESAKAARAVARSAVFFSQPYPPGESRHAIAVEDGADLRLALVLRRSVKGECFILYQRDDPWNPHSSYHADGKYHHKSFGQKIGAVSQRQPLDQNFKGAEHLGQFMGFGTAAPLCDSANFTSVLSVPTGVLESKRGEVLVDLVSAGTLPNPLHREGKRIVLEQIYPEFSPWLVVAIAR
jgi:hypothetical protein